MVEIVIILKMSIDIIRHKNGFALNLYVIDKLNNKNK